VVLAAAAAGVDACRLARRAGGVRALLRAAPDRLAALGAPAGFAAALESLTAARAREARARMAAAGIAVVAASEANYPDALRQLPDPPLALFVRGDGLAGADGARALAIVGSRRPTSFGARLARELGRFAASRGVAVVSGLATGIDAAAHEGALDGHGAPPIAVLGAGIDVAYPRANAGLHERVAAAGAVVSEYPPGTPPARWRFPARNRIVAALAGATLVVEAQARSGALITADHALELGRDVMAVPGSPAMANSAGTNALLKAGAGLIEGPEDLAAWLGVAPPSSAPAPTDLTEAARAVLAQARHEAADADALGARAGLGAAAVGAALVELQLAGAVVREAGGRWRAAAGG
jgi:DNA processing protein